MNNNHIIVLDYETGSLDVNRCQITQLAACHINPKSLKIGDIFNSEVCPQDPDDDETLTKASLDFCGKKKEELMDKPPLSEVWANFKEYLSSYSGSGKWNRPICAGYNIRGFDNFITARLCKEFGDIDTEGKPNLFSNFMHIDLMDTIWMITENNTAFAKYSNTSKHNIRFETVCKWLGISTDGLHDAEVDVKKEAAVIARFMNMYRTLMTRVPFEGAMANEEI